MRILGIDAGNKEASVALVVDGQLVRATCEERFSRRRFDDALPLQAIRAILAEQRLGIDDIDVVTGNVSSRRVRRALQGADRPQPAFPRRDDGPELHGMHHLSHAAFAWLVSGWPSALVVTVDNHGDDDTLVIFRAAAGELVRLGSVGFEPVPIGGVYEEATALTGFGVGGEGKLMGLAGYGSPIQRDAEAILRRTGQWTVHSDLLLERNHPLRSHLRAPWAKIRRPAHAHFAASVQRALEVTVLGFVRDAVEETGIRDVCIAGGVALNCSLNGALAAQSWVDRVFVPPSPADPGNAAGSALLWALRAGGVVGRGVVGGALRDGGLGVRRDPVESLAALRRDGRYDIEVVGPAASRQVAQAVAADLVDGRLVGWFEGGSEFGPRALGHRSIIADPRNAAVCDRLNDAKLRERWRPLAPSILADQAERWLAQRTPSPFMLLAFEATERCRNEAPGAVHVDGTTRAQTVHSVQPAYTGLIGAFFAQTGVPMVLNTSFNQAGEPIVETPLDAADCAARAGLDVLWVDGLRLVPRAVHTPSDTRTSRRRVRLAGPVAGGWPALLCGQTPIEASQHHDVATATDFARVALGLRGVDSEAAGAVGTAKAPEPTLFTGPPEGAATTPLTGAPTVIATPTSAWDLGTWPQNLYATTSTLTAQGVAGIRRSFRPDRLGSIRRLQVCMPWDAPRTEDPSVRDSRWRRAWSALSEGLALCRLLVDEQLVAVVCRGERLDDVHLVACATDGSCEVDVTLHGQGPMPAVHAENERGSVALTPHGRLVVRAQRDDGTQERASDTQRGSEGLFAAIGTMIDSAAQTNDAGTWPHAPDLLHDAGTDVDEAMVKWARTTWASPGRWAISDREAARQGADRESVADVQVGAATPTVELGERFASASALASMFLRPAGVAAGTRVATSFENATSQTAAVIEAMCAALGVVTQRGPSYHCAVTKQGGLGAQFTLFVAGDDAALSAVVEATAALQAATSETQRRVLQRKLGALYGYPSCCVAAWHRWQRLKLDASFTHAIAHATTGRWLAGCNVRPPARAADHLPCSFSCTATHAASKRAIEALEPAWPTLTMVLREAAKKPGNHATLGPLVEAAEAGVAAVQNAIRTLLGAPLLYVDTTRYICVLGGVKEVAHAESDTSTDTDPDADRHWRLCGPIASSSALIGSGQTEEERILQTDLQGCLAQPLAAALSNQTVLLRAPAKCWPAPARPGAKFTVVGDGLRVSGAAERLLVLPFEPFE